MSATGNVSVKRNVDADAERGLDADLAAHLLDDALADRETEAGAANRRLIEELACGNR